MEFSKGPGMRNGMRLDFRRPKLKAKHRKHAYRSLYGTSCDDGGMHELIAKTCTNVLREEL